MTRLTQEQFGAAWTGTLNLSTLGVPREPARETPNMDLLRAAASHAATQEPWARQQARAMILAEPPWWGWQEGFFHDREEFSSQYAQQMLLFLLLIRRTAERRGDEELEALARWRFRQYASLAALFLANRQLVAPGARNKDLTGTSVHGHDLLLASIGGTPRSGLSRTVGYSGWYWAGEEYDRGLRLWTPEEAGQLIPGGPTALPLALRAGGGFRSGQPVLWWAYVDGSWAAVSLEGLPEAHDSPTYAVVRGVRGGPPGYSRVGDYGATRGGPFKPTSRAKVQLSLREIRWTVKGHPWHDRDLNRWWSGSLDLPDPAGIRAGLRIDRVGVHSLDAGQVLHTLQGGSPRGALVPGGPPEGRDTPPPDAPGPNEGSDGSAPALARPIGEVDRGELVDSAKLFHTYPLILAAAALGERLLQGEVEGADTDPDLARILRSYRRFRKHVIGEEGGRNG